MLHNAGIAAKVISLELTVKIPMSPEDAEKYEELDKIITKCMTCTEKVQEIINGRCAVLTGTTQPPEPNQLLEINHTKEEGQ